MDTLTSKNLMEFVQVMQ